MIKKWGPDIDELEMTTIWSFPNRGNWATHNGNYRGNWSPYIPRNIIKRYSTAEELVLDAFVGSGTTMIEAKLLGRKAIGIDINPQAIEICKCNLKFEGRQMYEPKLVCGNASKMIFLKTNSVDLICTHPPYANIIPYSNGIAGDMSLYEVNEFVQSLREVSKEFCRVLKPGKICAFMIGDIRKNKNVIPLGFMALQVFQNSGFRLKEIIIKEQHNCQSNFRWQEKSKQYNFLLLAHEYLFVLQKQEDF